MENKFYTGFSRVTITPDYPVGISGYGNDTHRISDHVIDEAEATCIALKDSKGTIALLYTLDMCYVTEGSTGEAKERLNKNLGIPKDNIFLCATHTHSGPSAWNLHPSCQKWKTTFFCPQLEKAAREAMADFGETTAYGYKSVIDNHLHFVRRYQTDANTWKAVFGGVGKSIAHETHPDDDFQVIRFERPGKKEIILVNWAAHPCFNNTETSTGISADYPRFVRTYIEEHYPDAHAAFFQGAAGNVTARGALEGERPYMKYDEYAKVLVENAIPIIDETKKHELKLGNIKCRTIPLTLDINHSRDAEAPVAKEIYDLFMGQNNNRDEARRRVAEAGFQSIYEVRDIVGRSQMPPTQTIEVYALSFGDFGFACPSFEMFDTHGMQIKGCSDYKMTFICYLTNAYNSYIPSYAAFVHGGYEVTTCRYVQGTGEKIALALTLNLNEMKKEN